MRPIPGWLPPILSFLDWLFPVKPQPIPQPPCFPQSFHEMAALNDPAGCVMFFKSHGERDAFMKWFADIAMRPENLPR
jgi:hypothetical protein